jgi:hypothetical protein
MISKSPIRVFVTGQETMGYDPSPVVHKRLMNSSSGTVPDTTSVSEHRIQIQEWSGTRLETGCRYGFQVPLQENIRNSPDPAGFCRMSLTWAFTIIFFSFM